MSGVDEGLAVHEEAAAAATALAFAWVRFWKAVRAIEAHNRADRLTDGAS